MPTPTSVRLGKFNIPGRLLLAVLLLAILLVPALYRATHRGRIYPGVTVAGISLGGMSPADALALVERELDPAAPVVVSAGDLAYELGPQHGVLLDARDTVERAYQTGRTGKRPRQWTTMVGARMLGREVLPTIVIDDALVASAITGVAADYDIAPQDASVAVDGATVHLVAPREGRRLDQGSAMMALDNWATSGTWPSDGIELPVENLPPAVGDAGPAAARAQALLSGPITLRAGEDSWTLHPESLGGLLTTEVLDGRVVLDIERDRLTDWMEPITEVVSRTAETPRFRFDSDTGGLRLIRAGRSGQTVNVNDTADLLLAESSESDRLIRIALDITPPPLRDGVTARELGIRELIHEETSKFAGSPDERKHNIAVAASSFDGVLIPPDSYFSFNEIVGDISEDTGYVETKIIMDGATADGVGGGVCQVSTTLFRAAFWTGLPIVERLAHGYRVAYYEQGSPPGLDATVYNPVVDLKFQNDTSAWLLVETDTDEAAATVTFRFYGTAPEREVEMDGPEITGVETPPPPKTVVDPALEPGDSEKLELARNGSSVTVRRIVRRDGEEIEDVYYSKYRPTGAITSISPPPGWVPDPDNPDAIQPLPETPETPTPVAP